MAKSRIPAVIVGFETNGLGVARALKREGIPSVALAGPVWTPSCASRTSKVVMSSGWSTDAIVTDLMAIGRTLEARAPLLITKDDPVLWISANRAALSEFFHVFLPPPDIVECLMDKAKFYALAVERGWPVPKTWRASDRSHFMGFVEEVTYPCILKPVVKGPEFLRNSPKAFVLHSAAQLLKAYDFVSTWEPAVIVQEWIDGGDDRIAFALGYWDTMATNVALFPGRKLRQWRPECGNTAMAEPAPPEWQAPLIELTNRIYSSVGYRGLGSIEYKVSPEGRLVIMEPTVGRTNFQNEVAVLNGVNLPAIAYYHGLRMASKLERLLAPSTGKHRGIKLIDTLAEYRSARFYMSAGRLSWWEWLKSRSGPKQDMLYRHSDPLPFMLAVALSIASFMQSRINRIVLGLRGRRGARDEFLLAATRRTSD